MPPINLGHLGKTDEDFLTTEDKIAMIFRTIFGRRRGQEILEPGLLHKIDGLYGEKGLMVQGLIQTLFGYKVPIKDKDGKDTENGIQYPGLQQKMEIVGMQITAFGDQMTAVCRLLGITEEKLLEFILDTGANNAYLNNLGSLLREYGEKEQKKKDEIKLQLEKAGVTNAEAENKT